MTERASISLVVAASLAFAAMLAALGADLARAVLAASRIQAVADAAALAAAQELVRPSGRSPAEVASEYAQRGGARVVACRCDPRAADVVVEVGAEVTLPFLGSVRTVRRAARAAVVTPSGTEPLPPEAPSSRDPPFGRPARGNERPKGGHHGARREGRRLPVLPDAAVR